MEGIEENEKRLMQLRYRHNKKKALIKGFSHILIGVILVVFYFVFKEYFGGHDETIAKSIRNIAFLWLCWLLFADAVIYKCSKKLLPPLFRKKYLP